MYILYAIWEHYSSFTIFYAKSPDTPSVRNAVCESLSYWLSWGISEMV